MAFIRRVRTGSGATAVQIAEYVPGRRQRIVAHLGSAHTEVELGLLMARAQGMLDDAAQGELDLGLAKVARRAKRFARDNRTLNAQETRARDVVNGDRTARTPRFVKSSGDGQALDQKALARARRLAGLKGYVTNLPAPVMDADGVIASYHDLW